MRYVTIAVHRLRNAGYAVTHAEGVVPMRFQVEGLGSDLTADQLCDLADEHGAVYLGTGGFFDTQLGEVYITS
jgi:hypothetical protein